MSVPESPTMIARWLAPPAAATVSSSGLGSGLPIPNVSWPQTKAKRSAIPSFVIKSLAELSILLVQTAWRQPARAKACKRILDAGIKPAANDNMGVVMLKKIGEQRLERLRVDALARSGETALDERPRAGPDQRAGVFDRQRRKSFSRQQPIERGHQVLGRVGERAVEIIDDGWREASPSRPEIGRGGLEKTADPDRRDGFGQAVGADLGGDGAQSRWPQRRLETAGGNA